jgi:hypothetical protein
MEAHRNDDDQQKRGRGRRRWPAVTIGLANLAVNAARLLRDLING